MHTQSSITGKTLLFRITEETVGPGKTCIAWRPNGNTLALARNVVDMAWDKEGDLLGIIVDASALAILWNINTRNAEQLDTATGAKKIPVLGKHQRKITGVAMTKQDEILCCSDDNTITVSSADGETIRTMAVSGEPNDLQVGEVKRPGGNVDVILSAVLGKKTLYLATLSEKPTEKLTTDTENENSMNLQFQEKYGTIVAHVWFNDGYMIVGFEKGFVVCISAHPSEMGQAGYLCSWKAFGTFYMLNMDHYAAPSFKSTRHVQEIFSVAEYKTYLAAVAVSPSFGKILTVGDNQIKVREMRELNDIFVIMEVDTEKDLSQVECSLDGQLVAVASRGGGVSVYLTKMPSMGAAYGNTMAVLSSLNQITYLTEGDKQKGVIINIAIEPSHIAVGPYHIAVATNNRVWVYNVTAGNSQSVAEGEYLSSVIDMQLNDEFICVMMEGPAMTFPEQARNSRLVAAALSNHFFVFTTEYKAALWETFTIDRDTFIVYDNANIYVYLLNRSPIEGTQSPETGPATQKVSDFSPRNAL
nr:CRE-DYF-2 protein [Haemonchus contortus]